MYVYYLNSIAKSFVNMTNDREACPKRWVACLVHANCEEFRQVGD